MIAVDILAAPVSSDYSDCERIVGGVLAQPVLAVTSLAYVAVGVADGRSRVYGNSYSRLVAFPDVT